MAPPPAYNMSSSPDNLDASRSYMFSGEVMKRDTDAADIIVPYVEMGNACKHTTVTHGTGQTCSAPLRAWWLDCILENVLHIPQW